MNYLQQLEKVEKRQIEVNALIKNLEAEAKRKYYATWHEDFEGESQDIPVYPDEYYELDKERLNLIDQQKSLKEITMTMYLSEAGTLFNARDKATRLELFRQAIHHLEPSSPGGIHHIFIGDERVVLHGTYRNPWVEDAQALAFDEAWSCHQELIAAEVVSRFYSWQDFGTELNAKTALIQMPSIYRGLLSDNIKSFHNWKLWQIPDQKTYDYPPEPVAEERFQQDPGLKTRTLKRK